MSPWVSILTPCFNEEANIQPLYNRIRQVLEGKMDYEVVFVDDGSTDDTLREIKKIARTHSNVKYISLSRNFGHQYALKAGLDNVEGDCVIMMDSDLQHPPEFIGTMINKWKEGYDIVYTVREDDKKLSLFKRLCSRVFYRVINHLGDIRLEAGAADFRLIDKKVLNVFREDINEYFLFIRGLMAWVGFKQFAIRYKPAERHAGKTKYSLCRMLGFAINGVTSFSVYPLRIALVFGFITAILAGLYGIYSISVWFFIGRAVPGWTSIIMSVLFIGGIQMLMLGIIGEYIGKMFQEVKHRPKYIIKESNLEAVKSKARASAAKRVNRFKMPTY